MDFYDELSRMNLSGLLRFVEYKPLEFSNQEKVFGILDEIISKVASRILLISDPDVDGLMSALIVKEALLELGCTCVDVHGYTTRNHTVDKSGILEAIHNKYNYVIITDTGSSELETITRLCSYGVKVIILDHHNTTLDYSDYPDNCGIINTIVENRLCNQDKFALSAGALSFCVFDSYFTRLGKRLNPALSVYAQTSLFSDIMDMSNEINRSIYYYSIEVDKKDYPIFIKHFMNDYQVFGQRFVSFWFAPRINSLFRSEKFDVINSYFFDDSIDALDKVRYIEVINSIYETDREQVNILSDIVDVTELNGFVFCNLASGLAKTNLAFNNVQNYTGLIANKLCSKYGKAAIVVIMYENYYKGSFRDLLGRNYLSIFQQLCYANGHNAAFGMKIKAFDLGDFLDNLEMIDNEYNTGEYINRPIIIEHEFANPDNSLIEDMARYNEFSGASIPIALINKKLIGAMPEQITKYYYKYSWGDYKIQSDTSISFGSKMLIKPVRGLTTKLIYQV